MEINPCRHKHTLPQMMRKEEVWALNACASQFLMPSQKPSFTVMFMLLIQTRGA